MGVNAPIPKDTARLALAAESARRAISGGSHVFNEATHIRIHICEWHKAPPELQQIVHLSKESEDAPRSKWKQTGNPTSWRDVRIPEHSKIAATGVDVTSRFHSLTLARKAASLSALNPDI